MPRKHVKDPEEGADAEGALDDLSARIESLEMELLDVRANLEAAVQQDAMAEIPDGHPDRPPTEPDQFKTGGPNTLGIAPSTALTKGLLGLWNSWAAFGAAAGKTIPKIPYLPKDHDEKGALAWAAPDADAAGYGEGTTKSIQILASLLQLYGFAAAADGTVAKKVGTDLTWVLPSTLSVAYAATAGTATYVTDISAHAHHELSELGDDDHGQYWIQVGNEIRNYCTGVGEYQDGSAWKVIGIQSHGVILYHIFPDPGTMPQTWSSIKGMEVTYETRKAYDLLGAEILDFATNFKIADGKLYIGTVGPFLVKRQAELSENAMVLAYDP
jgi:hypothetical protein